MMLRRALLAGVAVLAALSPAKADFTFTLGTGATGFSFTSTTGGTALCAAASTHCFASVPINTAGAQLFTSGAPGLVTLTGTNNINNIAGTISLPTGAATQTTLASVLTALGSPFQAGGALAANQSVNVSQINAVTPLMGNGATGTGSQRVTIANDNTFPTGWGASTLASGSVASGAYSSGSIAAGAMVDFLTVRGTKAPGTAGANSLLTGCVYTAAGITLTDGQQAACQFTSTGGVLVSVANASTAIGNNADGVAVSTGGNSPTVGYGAVYNGTTWDRMPGTTAGVTVRSPTAANLNATVVGTGTFATQSALTATEVHAGEVGSNQIRVDVAQTVTASSAYTAGDAIGGLMTIAGASRVSGSLGAAGTGGIIQQVAANSKSLQTTQVDVFIFNSNPTGSTCTNKTAFALATADFDKVIGVASIPGTAANNSGWFGGGTGSVGQANNLAMAFDLASATSIYACAVARGTPTFTATSDISFKYQILRN